MVDGIWSKMVVMVGAIAVLGVTSGAPAKAEVFEKDGYQLDVQCDYKKKKGKLKAWAVVKGGKTCSTLKTVLMLTDGKQTVRFSYDVNNYEPSSDGVKIGPQSEKVSKTKKANWRAYGAEVSCL